MIPAWVDGALTPVGKLDAHQRGLRHKAVSVFVNCGSETLLQRRALSKYHTPGLWANACCTHPFWEEDPIDCATRRLTEELGLSGLTPEYVGHVHYRADVGNGLVEDEEVDIFVATCAEKPECAPSPDEVMDIRWIDFSEAASDIRNAPERYTPWISIYFARHLHMFDQRPAI